MLTLILILLTFLTVFLLYYYTRSSTEKFKVVKDGLNLELVGEYTGYRLQHITTFKPDDASFYTIFIKLATKGILVLRSDTFKIVDTFGDYPGTCIQVVNNHLYVGGPANIYRYTIDNQTGMVINSTAPKLIVRGMRSNRNSMSPIFIVNDLETKLYMHIQSLTNACQPITKDRKPDSPGELPCSRTMMDSGVWLYDPRTTNNTLDTGILVATGIRNMKSLALNDEGRLFGIIQGRDSLHELYPQYYSVDDGLAFGSDKLVEILPNTNFGHPYCYWNGDVQRFKLNPEYGGDGNDERQCNSLITKPLAGFNNHMGPNDILFDNQNIFGFGKTCLFVAWNGRPQPMQCDRTCSQLYISCITFNDAMIPQDNQIIVQFEPSDFTKPAGMCITPDNAMLITDSLRGKLYKLTTS